MKQKESNFNLICLVLADQIYIFENEEKKTGIDKSQHFNDNVGPIY